MVGEIEKLQDEIRKNPNDVQALRRLAVLFQRQGNFKDAVWLFIRCTDLYPEDHEVFFRTAKCFYEAGQENMSLMFAQKAVDLGGDQAKILGYMGEIYWRSGRTREAAPFLEQAVEKGNGESTVALLYASSLHLRGDQDRALEFAKLAYKKAPDNIYRKLVEDTVLSRIEALSDPADGYSDKRIGLHMNQAFHYYIMKPIFDVLSKSYNTIITGEAYWLRDFAPDIVFVADSQARTLRKIMPDCKFVFTCHGFSSKNHVFNAASYSDFACLSSPYQKERYEKEGGFDSDKLWTVGYAQMDMLFHDSPVPLKEEIDTSKKTILYAPTYNPELSSVPMLGPELVEKIRGKDSRDNLIIKPHPQIFKRNQDWIDWFDQAAKMHENVFFVDQEGANIMPYLKNADLLVSDASSSVFEFLAMDRPIVLLTNPEREKCTHYDPNGLEWRWRDLAEEVFDETELEAAIQRALKNPDKFTEKRNMYADKLFGELRQGMTGANIKIKIDELFLEQDDHKLKSVS